MDELRALWRKIEDLGFDWISIWDHFYAADLLATTTATRRSPPTPRSPAAPSASAAGRSCTAPRYRHPAVLANAITTIDHLSGGRADLGIGAGWSEAEYNAYGIPFPAPAIRLDILEEAARAIAVAAARRGHRRSTATHFDLTDARCEPKPVQARAADLDRRRRREAHAAHRRRARRRLERAVRRPPDVRAQARGARSHCEGIGRDPAEIRCAVNVGLAWDDDSLRAQFGGLAEFVRPGVLDGHRRARSSTASATYVAAGADQVNIALRAPWDVEALERLAPLLPR